MRSLFDDFPLVSRVTSCANDHGPGMFHGSAAHFSGSVRLAEIDYHIAIFHWQFDRIAEIALRTDVDAQIVTRQTTNCLPHAASCADKQHANSGILHAKSLCSVFGFQTRRNFESHFSRSKASRVLRSRAWFASLISHRGKRTSFDIWPRQASAVLTGTGLGSMNRSLKSGNILRCRLNASFTSPHS